MAGCDPFVEQEAPPCCHGRANFLDGHRRPRLYRAQNAGGFSPRYPGKFLRSSITESAAAGPLPRICTRKHELFCGVARGVFNSETLVERGLRIVHGDKEFVEKLGRKDLCPCNSRRRSQAIACSRLQCGSS